jgi:hypothetical protein
LDTPSAFAKSTIDALGGQLKAQVTSKPVLHEVTFEFTLTIGDPKPLLRLLESLESPIPNFLEQRQNELRSTIDRLLAEKGSEPVRRDAYEIWRQALRLQLVTAPSLTHLERWLGSEASPRVRGALIRLLGFATIQEGYDLSRVIPLLYGLRNEILDLRNNALQTLIVVVGQAPNPSPWVDDAFRAATLPDTNSERLSSLSLVMNQLLDREETIASAFDLFFRLCESQEIRTARQRVLGVVAISFTRVILKAFRLGSLESRQRLLALVKEVDAELGRAIVAGAYHGALVDLRPELDQLFEDPEVPEKVKRHMRLHKFHGERLVGGARWEELYELV